MLEDCKFCKLYYMFLYNIIYLSMCVSKIYSSLLPLRTHNFYFYFLFKNFSTKITFYNIRQARALRACNENIIIIINAVINRVMRILFLKIVSAPTACSVVLRSWHLCKYYQSIYQTSFRDSIYEYVLYYFFRPVKIKAFFTLRQVHIIIYYILLKFMTNGSNVNFCIE